MNPVNIAEKLKNISFFSGLSDEILKYLASKMILAKIKQGEVLSAEGSSDGKMYLLDSGSIDITKKGKSGESVLLRVVSAGEIMGVTSIFQEKPVRSATLTAREDSHVWILEHSVFQELIEGNTDYNPKKVIYSILGFLSSKVRKKNFQIADILSKDVDHRVRIAVFDAKDYTIDQFKEVNADKYSISFFKARLSEKTVSLAQGCTVICAFVNDTISREVVYKLKERGTSLIAMRCAGYNNVDLEACKEVGITVVRVPAYSPYAVAEHATALLMSLNRKIHRAYNRVSEGNFSLSGLVGFDLHNKTVGVIGTGKIGQCFINIMLGFGCKVLAYDKFQNEEVAKKPNVKYTNLKELFANSDVISIHVPLLKDTHHLINEKSIKMMKDGVVILNTSRGGLIDTQALINGLKSKKIQGAGLDVYEEEQEYFFEDHSSNIIDDDIFARLISFNNVIVTSHQAFLTEEALYNITEVTFENIQDFLAGKKGNELMNEITC